MRRKSAMWNSEATKEESFQSGFQEGFITIHER